MSSLASAGGPSSPWGFGQPLPPQNTCPHLDFKVVRLARQRLQYCTHLTRQASTTLLKIPDRACGSDQVTFTEMSEIIKEKLALGQEVTSPFSLRAEKLLKIIWIYHMFTVKIQNIEVNKTKEINISNNSLIQTYLSVACQFHQEIFANEMHSYIQRGYIKTHTHGLKKIQYCNHP